MQSLLFALCKHVNTSAIEQIENTKNFLYSAPVCKMEPSEIFDAIESAALFN